MESGLPNLLTIAVGCVVMLRCNLWTEQGLVNGSIGTVEQIIFRKGKLPPEDIPEIILVKFPNYTGPTTNGLVPIKRLTRYFTKKQINYTRTQLLLALL